MEGGGNVDTCCWLVCKRHTSNSCRVFCYRFRWRMWVEVFLVCLAVLWLLWHWFCSVLGVRTLDFCGRFWRRLVLVSCLCCVWPCGGFSRHWNFALTSCGKENLLNRVWVSRLAIRVLLLVVTRSWRANLEKWQEVESEVKDFLIVERREGILDAKVGGRTEPGEFKWEENEETKTGLVFKWEGKLRCALTGNLATD